MGALRSHGASGGGGHVAVSRPLLTVGHGTASQVDFSETLRTGGVGSIVDVRSAPGSRRQPQFGRTELEHWLPQANIGYRWEPALGGFRKTSPESSNVALRHPSFRGYADYMATESFRSALDYLLEEASSQLVAVMCAETLWWRCHRRLIADAAVLLHHVEVQHLWPDGHVTDHRVTEGARLDDGGGLVYDAGHPPFEGMT